MKRQTFSNEFNREAVRLLEQDGKEATQLIREPVLLNLVSVLLG